MGKYLNPKKHNDWSIAFLTYVLCTIYFEKVIDFFLWGVYFTLSKRPSRATAIGSDHEQRALLFSLI